MDSATVTALILHVLALIVIQGFTAFALILLMKGAWKLTARAFGKVKQVRMPSAIAAQTKTRPYFFTLLVFGGLFALTCLDYLAYDSYGYELGYGGTGILEQLSDLFGPAALIICWVTFPILLLVRILSRETTPRSQTGRIEADKFLTITDFLVTAGLVATVWLINHEALRAPASAATISLLIFGLMWMAFEFHKQVTAKT